MNATPRITIGMPVYNGAVLIAGSIESLLAQTFGDFELVVSDNASTDSTAEVVQGYARQDPRIRLIRQSVNLGVHGNYSFVARAARGEYLKWASSSDWCAPTFLERCLTALDREQGAVLAAPRTRLFEGDIAGARDYPDDFEILDDRPLDRFVKALPAARLNNAMNGLIRLSALRRTRLLEPYYSADLVLMGRLALLGKFVLIDEPLLYRRMEIATSTSLQDAATVRRAFYPRPSARALFQRWRWHLGWLRAAGSAPIPIGERASALALLARRGYWDKAALLGDFREAWSYLTHAATRGTAS